MSKIQIANAVDEINASIMKEVLIANSIDASYAHNISSKGRLSSCTIFCEEERAEEAIKLLKEKNLIKF